MVTSLHTNSRPARAARLLTTLVAMLALVALSFPANSYAASPVPKVALGILNVHASNYLHGYNLKGATLTATSDNGLVPYQAVTNYAGIAKMQVPEGKYHLTLYVAATYEPWFQDVVIAPNQTTYVEAQATLSSEMAKFNLNVLDAVSKSGVAAAVVMVFDSNGKIMAQGFTNEKGLFAAKIPMGIYTSTIVHPKYEAHKDFIEALPRQNNEIFMALAPLGAPFMGDMQIHVLDAYSYTPVKGAHVNVYDAAGTILDQGMTDETGTYYTCLLGGKYQVEVNAPFYGAYSNAHVITAGMLREYKILLRPIIMP